MSRKLLSLFAALFFALTLPACAKEDKKEAKVRETVEKILNTKVKSVTKTGYLGLYEVYFNGEIIYVDEKVTVILSGQLIDPKRDAAGRMRNITGERMAKLSAIQFSDLALANAIKQVRGDGKRILATFEDPNCGYCKRLAQDLLKVDNITHYLFLIPVLSEDSNMKTRQIWCAPDPAQAWNDWMLRNQAPVGKGDCDTAAIDRNIEFAHEHNINGTPALIFTDGELIPGALPAAQIEAKMNQLANK
jgi:thiol:disulfide interchange protein DsbC